MELTKAEQIIKKSAINPLWYDKWWCEDVVLIIIIMILFFYDSDFIAAAIGLAVGSLFKARNTVTLIKKMNEEIEQLKEAKNNAEKL